jgi:hypothetical protein
MLILSGLAGTCIILLGIGMLVWPRRFWYVTQGWWANNNPQDMRLSDTYLAWNAIQAVSIILLGTVLLIQGLAMQLT